MIADKLKSTLQQFSFDRSRLINFVLSKKNQGVFYCISNIVSGQVLNILSKISLRKSTDFNGIESRVLRVAAPVHCRDNRKVDQLFLCNRHLSPALEDGERCATLQEW